MKTRMLRQPGFHGGVLVRRVVIDDQMELEVLGVCLLIFLRKANHS